MSGPTAEPGWAVWTRVTLGGVAILLVALALLTLWMDADVAELRARLQEEFDHEPIGVQEQRKDGRVHLVVSFGEAHARPEIDHNRKATARRIAILCRNRYSSIEEINEIVVEIETMMGANRDKEVWQLYSFGVEEL